VSRLLTIVVVLLAIYAIGRLAGVLP